jgi:hypothetical protein
MLTGNPLILGRRTCAHYAVLREFRQKSSRTPQRNTADIQYFALRTEPHHFVSNVAAPCWTEPGNSERTSAKFSIFLGGGWAGRREEAGGRSS